MDNRLLTIIQYSLIIMVLYTTTLFVQWTYETKYTFNSLLEDIIKYDTQILKEAKYDKANIQQYSDIFIEVENIDSEIWLSKWNIFDWGEAKYINEKNRKSILENLNYWRKTGKLPTFYNLDIKSTFNFGGENGKDNS